MRSSKSQLESSRALLYSFSIIILCTSIFLVWSCRAKYLTTLLVTSEISLRGNDLDTAAYLYDKLKRYPKFLTDKGIDADKFAHYLNRGVTKNPYKRLDSIGQILFRIRDVPAQRLYLYIFGTGDIYLLVVSTLSKQDNIRNIVATDSHCASALYLCDKSLTDGAFELCEEFGVNYGESHGVHLIRSEPRSEYLNIFMNGYDTIAYMVSDNYIAPPWRNLEKMLKDIASNIWEVGEVISLSKMDDFLVPYRLSDSDRFAEAKEKEEFRIDNTMMNYNDKDLLDMINEGKANEVGCEGYVVEKLLGPYENK